MRHAKFRFKELNNGDLIPEYSTCNLFGYWFFWTEYDWRYNTQPLGRKEYHGKLKTQICKLVDHKYARSTFYEAVSVLSRASQGHKNRYKFASILIKEIEDEYNKRVDSINESDRKYKWGRLTKRFIP